MASKSTKRTVPKTKKPKAPRVLYTLNPGELEEYRARHGFMMTKNMELHAASTYVEAYQNYLIEEHGLPVIFDLNLENGQITERPTDTEVTADHAENGRV